ncbi:MAG: TIGR02710 family CRISPR-associated CARF protein, partial [candidate division WOR-3 bacterium]|nr:TIGR02710 family CRISPR-associated CARF protein [candidate division WOR-3 bacterium]
RGKDRKVINGSETSFTFEPVGIFTSFAIDTAINFIKKYRFDSALELLEGINKGLLTDEEKALVENLRYLIRAYNYWDKFDHIKFSTNYDKVKFNHPDLQQFKIKDKTKAHVNTIGEKLKDKQISDLAIADLVNNAKRRYEEGKYDDAVARLYRTVEMLAQWRLKTEYNQDSANITLDDLPQKTREWIIKSCKDGKIQIGLQACYQLLADLEHPLGKEFESDEKLKGLLRTRNDSILAHGIKPIEKSTCEELIQVIINYCKKYIPDFNKLLCELEFPWQCKQNPSQPY